MRGTAQDEKEEPKDTVRKRSWAEMVARETKGRLRYPSTTPLCLAQGDKPVPSSGRGHTVGCHDYLAELQPGYLWTGIISRIQAPQVFECSLGIFQEMSENSD